MYFGKNPQLLKFIEKFFSEDFSSTLGNSKTESGLNEDGSKWYKTTFTSNDGTYTSTSYVSGFPYSTSLKSEEEYYKSNHFVLNQLKQELDKAISTENFEEAVKLRDTIKEYEKSSEKITELKAKLEKAISTQNFEEAIILRDDIKKLEKI